MQDVHLKEMSSNMEVLKCSSQLGTAIDNMKSVIQDKTFYSTNDEIKIRRNAQREKKHKEHMNKLMNSIGYNQESSNQQNTIVVEAGEQNLATVNNEDFSFDFRAGYSIESHRKL